VPCPTVTNLATALTSRVLVEYWSSL
jgi:hypothetical protein